MNVGLGSYKPLTDTILSKCIYDQSKSPMVGL
jgi:hypothetical protein